MPSRLSLFLIATRMAAGADVNLNVQWLLPVKIITRALAGLHFENIEWDSIYFDYYLIARQIDVEYPALEAGYACDQLPLDHGYQLR